MTKEIGGFLGQVGGFLNEALTKVGDVAKEFADGQIEMAKKNAPPQRRTYEERRDAYARMGDEGKILNDFIRSSSDGSSTSGSSRDGSTGTQETTDTVESGVRTLRELTGQGRKENGPQNGPLASPPPPSESESSSKKNKEARTTNCFAGLKKAFSSCCSCLTNPLTFLYSLEKNFQEDVKTKYKKDNNKNPEVKRQDGATKESQTSASVFGSFRERLSKAWRAGVDIKVGVNVTSNGGSREYSTKSELRPLSNHELKEGATSVANTVIGAAGSSYQAMKKAKKDALGQAEELVGLVGSSSESPSTSFRDLKASAARAMGSLSKTDIPSPDLPTASQVRASISFRGLKASAASAMDSLSGTTPSLPAARQIRASLPSLPAASQVRASLPDLPAASQVRASLPSLKGMRELAASLGPVEGAFQNMRGSLPSMPTLQSLPSSIMPVLKISSGR